MVSLYEQKSKDYGSKQDPFHNVRAAENFGIPAWLGIAIRIQDKISRLQALSKNGRLANEPAEDTFKDIAVYAMIALALWREANGEQPNGPAGHGRTAFG